MSLAFIREVTKFAQGAITYEHTLGPDHPDDADPFNKFANVLRNRGQLEEAETLCRRALIIAGTT